MNLVEIVWETLVILLPTDWLVGLDCLLSLLRNDLVATARVGRGEIASTVNRVGWCLVGMLSVV